MTTSFGVASTGPSGPDMSLKVDALIRARMNAYIASKQEGRNRTCGVEIEASPPLKALG